MKGTESVGVRILLGIVSFLLCVCLFVTAVAAIAIMDVRVITSKQKLQNLISDTLFSPVAVRPIAARSPAGAGAGAAVQQASAKLAATRRLAEADTEDTDKVIVRWVYDQVKAQFGDQLPVTYDKVEQFFERSTVKDFLADKISSVLNDYYTGVSTTTITDDEIRQQLNGNKALIEECFSFTVTDDAVEYVVNWVKTSGLLDYIKAESIDSLLGGGSGSSSSAGSQESAGAILGSIVQGNGEVGLAGILTLVRSATSTTMLIGVLSAAVILIGLLILANLRRIHVALIDSGITILLAGCLMLLPVALSGMVSAMIPGAMGKLIQQILLMTGTVSGTAAGIGVVLIIGGIILRSVTRKKTCVITTET